MAEGLSPGPDVAENRIFKWVHVLFPTNLVLRTDGTQRRPCNPPSVRTPRPPQRWGAPRHGGERQAV